MQNISEEEQKTDRAHRPVSRRSVVTTGGLMLVSLVIGEGLGSGMASAHSARVLRGRSLLIAMVDRAFMQLKGSGGFWNGAARLPLPQAFGKSGAWVAPALADPGQRETLQRWLNEQAFEAALRARSILIEAAHELPLKIGHEKYKDKEPAAEFLHRMLGPAVFNAVSADLYAKITSRDDPVLSGMTKRSVAGEGETIAGYRPPVGLGSSARLDAAFGFGDTDESTGADAAVAQLSRETEYAIWAALRLAESQLRSGTGLGGGSGAAAG